jgi:hypothetical protein
MELLKGGSKLPHSKLKIYHSMRLASFETVSASRRHYQDFPTTCHFAIYPPALCIPPTKAFEPATWNLEQNLEPANLEPANP